MKEKIKKKIVTWEKIAAGYTKLLPPNQPSQDDCKNYGLLIARALKNKKNPKVMVMGATPQLRRILYTYEFLQNAEVLCVDINPMMYRAMKDFFVAGRHSNEEFVRASWLETGFPNQYFDLIVGDEVISNIDVKLRKKLFQEMSRILKKEGAWITRHNVYLPENKNTTAAKIITELGSKIVNGEYDFQLAMNVLFLSGFYFGSATKNFENTVKDSVSTMREEYNKNLRNHRNAPVIDELLNFCEDIFVPMGGDYKWFVLSKKASEQELKEFFSIQDEIYSSDYAFSKNAPIYVLKKK